MSICGLCDRELGYVADRHHLVPKSRGGKEVVNIHKICHRKIHSTFSEKELEKYYNTFEKLRESVEIQHFVAWVSKKDINFYSGSRDANRKKK